MGTYNIFLCKRWELTLFSDVSRRIVELTHFSYVSSGIVALTLFSASWERGGEPEMTCLRVPLPLGVTHL